MLTVVVGISEGNIYFALTKDRGFLFQVTDDFLDSLNEQTILLLRFHQPWLELTHTLYIHQHKHIDMHTQYIY